MRYIYSGIILISITLSSHNLLAQCDLTLGDYAAPGSYEVHFNPEKTERTSAPQQLADCEHLLQIESARRDDRDVVLEIDNYIIVVTSRKRLSQVELQNQEQ